MFTNSKANANERIKIRVKNVVNKKNKIKTGREEERNSELNLYGQTGGDEIRFNNHFCCCFGLFGFVSFHFQYLS